jgi:hypothetical protein
VDYRQFEQDAAGILGRHKPRMQTNQWQTSESGLQPSGYHGSEVSALRRYLVVANQTLGGEHLAEAVKERLAAGECRFHILVPATSPADHAVWTEGEALALATERLERALARFRELGAEADGAVGDPSPLEAVHDALRDERFDEIILSTLPPGVSRWLGQDLIHRVERAVDVPVTHVVGEPEGPPREP